jgi:hypothetical protein
MPTPLESMIDSANLVCTKCGAKAGLCDCWENCSCGYAAEKGKPCSNPRTAKCSTKVKYGQYNRRTKRYE